MNATQLIWPFETKMTVHTLNALNQVFDYTDLYRQTVTNELQKALPSIILLVGTKLKKKHLQKALTKHEGKKFKVKLTAYEAIFFEEYIRGISMSMSYGYEKTIALKIADEINQHYA